jgi:hypothetical protein
MWPYFRFSLLRLGLGLTAKEWPWPDTSWIIERAISGDKAGPCLLPLSNRTSAWLALRMVPQIWFSVAFTRRRASNQDHESPLPTGLSLR